MSKKFKFNLNYLLTGVIIILGVPGALYYWDLISDDVTATGRYMSFYIPVELSSDLEGMFSDDSTTIFKTLDVRDINQLVIISIKNASDNCCEELNVTLPYDGYFEYRETGKQMESGPFKEKISLGSFDPGSEGTFYAWLYCESINIPNEGDILLRHSQGIIHINWQNFAPKWAYWISRSLLNTAILSLIIVLVLIVGPIIILKSLD